MVTIRYHDFEVYKNIISTRPRIDTYYIEDILCLSAGESVSGVDISGVTETDTALIIKASVSIRGGRGKCVRVRPVFIKTSKPDEAHNPYHEKNMREGAFYTFLMGNGPVHVPVATCHDAFISEDKGAFVIVLDDLAAYHAPTHADLLSTDVWFSCAQSLARFHAAFWNDARIGTDAFPTMTPEKIESEAQTHREYLNAFITQFRDRFDNRTINIFERAMSINIQLIAEQNQRAARRDNVTICHGDSHIYNFMLGIDIASAPVMVDFQFWGDGYGVGDLAHLTRVGFPEPLRKNIQTQLVEHYYATLVENGVKGYSFDDCMSDYRKAVATIVLIPMWQYCCFGIGYEAWIGDIKDLADNYECMDCDAIYSF